MNYTERLSNVTVLGAAGKMGSGILLLTAIEMADQMLKPENKGTKYVLNAMDISSDALQGLIKYIAAQALKLGEKKMVELRGLYADRRDLIDNGEIIDAYVADVLSIIRPTTLIEAAYDSTLIFEAIAENEALKVKIFSQIREHNNKDPWFFTNTSSVPIHKLNEGAKLNGRILGFHFYNPPAVQKLVELITLPDNPEKMKAFALQYAKNLRKTIVPSNDIAGFIGNGHFMRDALHGIAEAERLSSQMPLYQAIYAINKVSQEYLMRPMGIFQLIDYVGVDVVRFIMEVMNPQMPDENLHSDLLDKFFFGGIKGGQNADGSQKDGILKYEKGKITAVCNPETFEYMPVGAYAQAVDDFLGQLPASVPAWKNLVRSKNKDGETQSAYDALKNAGTKGAEIALAYAKRSKEIGENLVKQGVANNPDDVNTVMLTGFFHAYGPVNNYID